MEDIGDLNELFEGFEQKNATEVPKNIKKTLKLMDYSRFMISKADAELLIEEIEDTLKNVVPSVIEENEKEEYFGKLYKNCPEKFKFFSGHKTLIRNLVKHAFLDEKGKQKSKKDCEKGSNERGRKRKASTEGDDGSEEVENCKSLVIKWFKKKMQVEIKECKVQNLKITDNEIQLSIQCPLCSLRYQCHKIKNQSEQGWFLSNLYRHVNSEHIEKEKGASQQLSQPISNFFLPQTVPENNIVIISDDKIVHVEENGNFL